MNNIMTTNTDLFIRKEAINLFKDGGKYACIALGIYVVYDLCVKGMEKGYAFNVDFDPEGKVDIKFTPSTVAEG